MCLLRERLYERASLKDIELSAEEELRLLRDLNRWLKKDKRDGKVITEDGSFTLISAEYGEPYHSISAGALTESLEKFVKPAGLTEKIRASVIRILDLGFGLGYNTTVALYELRKRNPSLSIEVLCFDINLPYEVPLLVEPYKNLHRKILDALPQGTVEGAHIRFVEGDLRKSIRYIEGFRADVVFHDLFSPYRNAEGWSFDLLSLIKDRMRETGVWVSYTSSLPVRKALKLLGFNLGSSKPVGRKRCGTVAYRGSGKLRLSESEERKIEESPYSVPFRDPSLNLEPLDILLDYRLSVLLLERETSSAGRRELSPQRPL